MGTIMKLQGNLRIVLVIGAVLLARWSTVGRQVRTRIHRRLLNPIKPDTDAEMGN